MALNGVGNSVLIGGLHSSGHKVFTYSQNTSNWSKKGNDIVLSGNDLINISVDSSEDGNIIAISECYELNEIIYGKTTILSFDIISNTWITRGQTIDHQVSNDEDSLCISMNSDGSIIAIGSILYDTNTEENIGCVRIFTFDGNQWQQNGTTIEGQRTQDYFGQSLSLNSAGDIIAISSVVHDDGFDDEDTDKGIVRTFRYEQDWTQIGTGIVGESKNELLGISIKLSSNGQKLATNSFGLNNDDTNIDNGLGITKVFYLS